MFTSKIGFYVFLQVMKKTEDNEHKKMSPLKQVHTKYAFKHTSSSSPIILVICNQLPLATLVFRVFFSTLVGVEVKSTANVSVINFLM